MIGVNADDASTAGGGSAFVRPLRPTSVLDTLRERLGPTVDVTFTPGTDPIGPGSLLPGSPPVPSDVVTPDAGGQDARGFLARYWPNPAFEGEPALTRVDPTVELNRGFFDFPDFQGATPKRAALPPELGVRLSARWSGTLTAPATGEYVFTLTVVGSGRVRLDGETLLDASGVRPEATTTSHAWDGTGARVVEAARTLEAGQTVQLSVEYAADAPEQYFLYGAQVRFGWRPPAGTLTPAVVEAARAAREADVAVVVARTFESEAMDRATLALPHDQAGLIRAVADANPRTVVVLMSGGPVETTSWDERVGAVLEAWYAGQAQGRAVVDVLLGDVNPSGKLPLSFPQGDRHTPLTRREQYPGQHGEVHYVEGVNVGYRGYEALGLTPRFPFGFGLSFTTFALADLSVTPDEPTAGASVTVAFDVTNTGGRAGVEVAQVYLRRPGETRRLAGWSRVPLAAGERRRVEVTLDPGAPERPFARWNVESGRWDVLPGVYEVLVGASSTDLALRAVLHVPDALTRSERSLA
ncbi:glycoside hydrolase family 3 C-terminal domain-containing protein [Deinococcus pimensis]|uniref:glycoside hydrolase family 3 C-terminal domain-containing protein n=1 Tax=Deinococcus pimensis TaxID=309888 RepID=UPI0004B6A7EC|nr:glycoside hydrolase family 3 C-terminal domain-containing protein [Deinococcus pimensis]